MQFFKQLFFAFTKKEKVLFLICAAIAVVSFFGVAGMVVAQMTEAVPVQGGQFVDGVVGQPEYVNPVTAQSDADLSLVKLIYANIPDIADSISSSSDGMTWTIHLKSGLTWQDGQQLTSDDVIFTVQSIQDPDSNSPLATDWQGVTVNRVSELELTFTLANPYAFFSDNLANLYVAPKHIFADIPPGNWRLSEYNLKPVGSGPYAFASYDEGSNGFISRYTLAAWKGYAGQQVNIKNLTMDFFPNMDALLKSFASGGIDGFGGASSQELASVTRPYNLYAWRTPSYYAIFWNTSKNLALQDSVVRQALSLAVDRNDLISSVLGGHGAVDDGPVPPDANYFATPSSSLDASSSLANASALLNQDGWTVTSTDAGTFRAKVVQKTAVPLEVNLTVPNIDYLVATAQALQSRWESIGVEVTIATDTPDNIIANTIKNRAYEGLLFGNVLGPSSDLYSFWDSSQRFSPGLNLAIYNNPHVDSLIENARQNTSDASRTIELAAAQAAIENDNPAVFLYSPDYLYVAGNNIGGIVPDTLIEPSDLSREMIGWYLDTKRVIK